MKTSRLLNRYFIPFGKYIVVGVLVILSSLAFLYPQIFNCEIIRFSGFRALKQNVYASSSVSSSQSRKLLKYISQSEMRVDSFYTGKTSRPVIIVCNNQEEYVKYCRSTEGAGCSLGTPWGSTFIILNMQEVNIDVISHEMSHIELLTRLGWWKTTMQIPQWFNEGIALMLDTRFVSARHPVDRYMEYMDEWLYYTRGGQEILELEDIESVKDFFRGNQQYVMLAYMTSGLEVSYWLHNTGSKGMSRLIAGMQEGQGFESAYRNAEQLNGENSKRAKLPLNPLRRPLPARD
ncbi:hypothetical protein [Dyadobacter sp. CY312]|uniref:hypothetical protein n=1 Tax=Dyadobacter sp. CY312 TaxID=2907303 RepID=UPI001F2BB462|nr:hypothetical protein [Dyadobacter sp. CY312]MCE7041300.1 hypothetical protein [Dyadobacter sp. CY312]